MCTEPYKFNNIQYIDRGFAQENGPIKMFVLAFTPHTALAFVKDHINKKYCT